MQRFQESLYPENTATDGRRRYFVMRDGEWSATLATLNADVGPTYISYRVSLRQWHTKYRLRPDVILGFDLSLKTKTNGRLRPDGNL